MSFQYSTYMEARMQQKHDVAENWNKINNFVPGPGEIVVYDKDEDFARPRVKIGDGESSLKDLNFFTGEVYTQDFEPVGAKEGAIWITPNGYSSSEPDPEGVVAPSDWDVNNSDAAGYVKNRPIWKESLECLYEWDQFLQESDQSRYITNFSPSYSNISNLKIYLNENGIEKEQQIVGFFNLLTELDEKIQELNNTSDIESKIFLVNGNILKFPSNCWGILNIKKEMLGLICGMDLELYNQGIYFFKIDKIDENGILTESYNITKLNFNYIDVKIKSEYNSHFKKSEAANVYVLNTQTLGIDISEETVALLMNELSRFKPGEVVLIPSALSDILGQS